MTIYVFGAGASRHAGYPVASHMATELFSWKDRFPASAECRSAAEGLLERFGTSPNMEDVNTQLRAEIRT
jgi:hypothetical protein